MPIYLGEQLIDNVNVGVLPTKTEVNKIYDLNMSDGNQVVTPPANYTYSSVTINKPDTLKSSNILNGVNIGGVTGNVIVKEEESPVIELNLANGDQNINPTDGKTIAHATVVKPSTLIPSNIIQNINIGGVVGTAQIKEEESKTVDLSMTSGNQTLIPDAGKSFSSVTILKPASLRSYNIKQGISIGGVTGSLETRERKSEWLPHLKVDVGNDEIHLLAAIYEGENEFALSAVGTDMKINLGYIGAIDMPLTSSKKIEFTINYDDVSNDSLTSYGYKQVWVKIFAPKSLVGGIQEINLQEMVTGANVNKITTWLEYYGTCSELNKITISAPSTSLKTKLSMLEIFSQTGTSKQTDYSFMFSNCNSLFNVLIHLKNALSLNSMFAMCTSLTSIAEIDAPNATTAVAMFSGCSALEKLPSTFNLPLVSNAPTMFSNCKNLYEINSISLPSLENATNIFYGCSNITCFQNTLSKATTVDSMFSGTNLITFYCHSMGKVINLTTNTFNGCNNLRRCRLSGFLGNEVGVSFALPNPNLMSESELNALFTSLGTATNASTTITITGSLGAATCDTSIATAKGWTIVG